MDVTQPPFQVFIDTHREDVYRFLVAAVGPHDADDCFQETFVAAMRAYPRLRGGSNLRAWVLTIANRKAIDLHRARARRPLPVEELPEPAVSFDEPGQSELWSQVRELPPRQRAAVLY
ncbi:MAG: RNA polymerase sigma factor, partial [Thermoleophilaceae bacterium]|nr:RNA polymerase sigma factor [Thermoleophilaceae bacterium]